MSDLVLADKDEEEIRGDVLERYGVVLPSSDLKRRHLDVLIKLLAEDRSLIDFAGKQGLLRYVSDDFIDDLAELRGPQHAREPALKSTCIERFFFPSVEGGTVPAGTRVTDGSNLWEVVETNEEVTIDGPDVYVASQVRCLVAGASSNGVAPGRIDTLVDPDNVPGCIGVANTTTTSGGIGTEDVEEMRTRLRDVPEGDSTCGNGGAYRKLALDASTQVIDAVAIGPDDGEYIDGVEPAPGEVRLLILQGTRNRRTVTSATPAPGGDLISLVGDALAEANNVRPLNDDVTVAAPSFVDTDCIAEYWLSSELAEAETEAIREAIEEAFDAFVLWQQSKIGRDKNPNELTARLMNAGAKRVTVSALTFAAILRDQSVRVNYTALYFGGVEEP